LKGRDHLGDLNAIERIPSRSINLEGIGYEDVDILIVVGPEAACCEHR
jgi:hypothetical protein